MFIPHHVIAARHRALPAGGRHRAATRQQRASAAVIAVLCATFGALISGLSADADGGQAARTGLALAISAGALFVGFSVARAIGRRGKI